MRAYVLVNVEPGRERDIIQGKAMSAGISSFKGVVQSDVVHGSCDLVITIEGDPKTIDETIMKIRSLPGVRKTESLLSFF